MVLWTLATPDSQDCGDDFVGVYSCYALCNWVLEKGTFQNNGVYPQSHPVFGP